MAALSVRGNDELRRMLQDAVIKCSERCLYQSAKWAAELLNSIPDSDASSPADTEVDSPMSNVEQDRPVATGVLTQNENIREARLEAAEVNKYLMAKTYFHCREFDRCAAVFLPMTLPRGQISPDDETSGPKESKAQDKKKSTERSAPEQNVSMNHGFPDLSQKALFLALYAKYMSGEKRRDEESEMILGPADNGSNVNKELSTISHTLEARMALQEERGEEGQGWLEFLYGIVLTKMTKNRDDEKMALKWLTRSVHAYPFNWGAWQELGSLIGSNDELHDLMPQLPQNIMTVIFHIFENQELFQVHEPILAELKRVRSIFPTSAFLKSQKALLHYHAKDFVKAERIFTKIVHADPLRLDDLDTYSNILYVMERRAKLAFIAQVATATDKFRPETCCVVGNYYAMKSEHEKAVMYFRRALTLDRNFLSAWTLMGHEFVELKNTQAAIECYRRAVDVNRKDFRAWYGLGQTYEVLEMHFYALFYYKHAAALSPHDPKMWNAVGSCFGSMDRPAQAIKAYKRALVAGSYFESGGSFNSGQSHSRSEPQPAMDPEVLYSIARMYDRLNDTEATKEYLELTLMQEEGGSLDDENSALRASLSSSVGGAGEPSGQRLEGVGTTPTTCRARMWLAKMEYTTGTEDSLKRALILANELCQDGWEVEEAKGLMRDIRARMVIEGRSH